MNILAVMAGIFTIYLGLTMLEIILEPGGVISKIFIGALALGWICAGLIMLKIGKNK